MVVVKLARGIGGAGKSYNGDYSHSTAMEEMGSYFSNLQLVEDSMIDVKMV